MQLAERTRARRPGWDEMEEVELRAWEDVHRAAREEGVPGIEVVGLGYGTALFAPGLEGPYLNRAAGVPAEGLTEMAAALVGAFAVRGIRRFSLQPLPGAARWEVVPALGGLGYRRGESWVRLHRPAGDAPWVLTDLDVVPAGPDHASALVEIHRACFGDAASWLPVLVGRRDWNVFVALDGRVPVATGAFHLQEDRAWMGLFATLPSHGGQGAQLALMSEMILQANRRRCGHLVMEAPGGPVGRPTRIHRNAMRMGFGEAYRRESWIHGARPGGRTLLEGLARGQTPVGGVKP